MSEMKSNEQLGQQFLREGIKSRVRRLRLVADEIERESGLAMEQAEAGRGMYATVASNAIRAITWGVANMTLDSLVATAAEADVACAKGE